MADFLHRDGMKVHHEVRFNGRIADIVGVGQDLAAVELKLTDWKQGLRQAMAYQLACTRSYLCLPFERALKMASKSHYFEKEGVGVLGCVVRTGEIRIVIQARPSTRILPFMADFLRQTLSKRYHWMDAYTRVHRQDGDQNSSLSRLLR